MPQIILNVSDDSLVPRLCAILKHLRGVASVRVEEDEFVPNAETLESLEEAKRGEFAAELDTSSEEAMLASIMNL